MEHATDLTGLAYVVITALACGMLFAHFRQPPLVGYLLAGVLLGPTGFQVVQSEGMIKGFAELGVLMLLFIVGMELSVRTLKYTWRLALPAVAMQTGASLLGHVRRLVSPRYFKFQLRFCLASSSRYRRQPSR